MAWDKDILHRMHVELGMSFGAMADVLGETRSAVAGACRRLGITRTPEKPSKPEVPSLSSGAVDLGPKEPKGCRWINGDPKTANWSFCQERQRPGSSYCDHHHAKAYVPAKRRDHADETPAQKAA